MKFMFSSFCSMFYKPISTLIFFSCIFWHHFYQLALQNNLKKLFLPPPVSFWRFQSSQKLQTMLFVSVCYCFYFTDWNKGEEHWGVSHTVWHTGRQQLCCEQSSEASGLWALILKHHSSIIHWRFQGRCVSSFTLLSERTHQECHPRSIFHWKQQKSSGKSSHMACMLICIHIQPPHTHADMFSRTLLWLSHSYSSCHFLLKTVWMGKDMWRQCIRGNCDGDSLSSMNCTNPVIILSDSIVAWPFGTHSLENHIHHCRSAVPRGPSLPVDVNSLLSMIAL